MATVKELEEKTLELLSTDGGRRTFVHLLFQADPERLANLCERVRSTLAKADESEKNTKK